MNPTLLPLPLFWVAACSGDLKLDEPTPPPPDPRPLGCAPTPEVCDQLDNDCDGDIDEDASDARLWFEDHDQDGYGRGPARLACSDALEGPYAVEGGDCDDDHPDVFPGAKEVCNDVDDDCDGQIDEGWPVETFWLDQDGDGFGAGPSLQGCDVPEGHGLEGGDCDDGHPDVNPGADERCNDLDDDCDHQIDEGLVFAPYFVDADGDGVGVPPATLACAAPAGTAPGMGDCDDADPARYPGAVEVCNGLDDDCDFETDESGGVSIGSTLHPTLSLALAAASSGDVLHVCPGTHVLTDQGMDGMSLTVVGQPEARVSGGTLSLDNGASLRLEALTFEGQGAGRLVEAFAGSSLGLVDTTVENFEEALYIVDSTLTVTDTDFETNDRAVAVWGDSVATLVDVQILRHHDPGLAGGGTFVAQHAATGVPTLTLDHVRFTDNVAADGIVVLGGTALQPVLATATGVELSRNETSEVGALVLDFATLTGDVEIHAHEGQGTGGGVTAHDAVVEGLTVMDASADQGGGVYAVRSTLASLDVRSNHASHGGGLFLVASVVRDAVIEDNTAAIFGGGLFLEGSTLTALEDVTIRRNEAVEKGGGLYLDFTDVELRQGVVHQNHAPLGAGAFAERSRLDSTADWAATGSALDNEGQHEVVAVSETASSAFEAEGPFSFDVR